MSGKPKPVLWASVATRDLDEIVAFVSAERPTAASRLLALIERRAKALGPHPLLGRVVPELRRLYVTTYRELVIAPYRLVYRADADRVLVLGVFDSRRNLEDVLLSRLLGL